MFPLHLHLPRLRRVVLAAAWSMSLCLPFGLPQAAAAQALRPAKAQDAAPPAINTAGPVAEASSDQIRMLEQQVESVLTEARRQQVLLAQMRQQLAAAESGNAWLPWLLLGLALAGSAAAWLALRVRRLKRELLQHRWASAADDAPASRVGGAADLRGTPLLSPDQPLLSPRSDTAPGGVITSPDMAIAAGPGPHGATALAGPALGAAEFSLGTGVPPRPVSVEELLDLDQQVDFFLVLGQAQSAIDLLLGHVRSTGGTNALPYFRLLEIYRQQGDDEAYERTRERFNQRFNASAPDLSGDLASGRTLEDYPEVVQRLQRAWAQPLRAAAELESLLLRRADLEPFDLPAYREVLMLHALVRDLPASALHAAPTALPNTVTAEPPAPSQPFEPAPDAGVDLLLPLGEDGWTDAASPLPLSERASAQAMLAEWVFTRAAKPATAADEADAAWPVFAAGRPDRSMAVDLDLSDFAPAPREFTRPAAFTDLDLRRDGHRSDLGALDEGQAQPPLSRR